MNINRHNYEEFFLLYVDNELTAADKKLVEQFIQQNADLAGELELLRQVTLTADDAIVFAGKESLLKKESDSFINMTNYEEYLVAYIDNELKPAERKEFEKFAAAHPQIKEELGIYQQTKLQPEEEIVFANKEILYKKEEEVRVVSMQWWKIAVAAAVILAIGITTVTVVTNKTATPVIDVAKTNPAQEKNKAVKTDPEQTIQKQEATAVNPVAVEKNNKEEIAAVKNTTDTKEKNNTVQKSTAEKIRQKIIAPAKEVENNDAIIAKTTPVKSNNLPVPEKNIETKINEPHIVSKDEINALNNTVASNKTTAKENNQEETVTNNSGNTFDNKETAQQDLNAVFASNNESKNKKIRGFFRKATRIFEKRTNISAADDDDKVLIGVLAVKLK